VVVLKSGRTKKRLEVISCDSLIQISLRQVRDLIRAARDRTGWSFPISVKIRLDPDLKRTNQLIETAIATGVSHISVHGRTRHQASTHPVDIAGIGFAVECARSRVPIVANGDMWSHKDAEFIRGATGARGVMSARGLLANPALFAGYDAAPIHAIQDFVKLSTAYALPFALAHKHIAFMLESAPLLSPPPNMLIPDTTIPSKGIPITRAARAHYHSLVSMAGVLDFLRDECGMELKERNCVDPWSPRT